MLSQPYNTYAQEFQVLQKAWGTEQPQFHTYPIVPTAYPEFAIISHFLNFHKSNCFHYISPTKKYHEVAQEGFPRDQDRGKKWQLADWTLERKWTHSVSYDNSSKFCNNKVHKKETSNELDYKQGRSYVLVHTYSLRHPSSFKEIIQHPNWIRNNR